MNKRAIAAGVGALASAVALLVLVIGGHICGQPVFKGAAPSSVIFGVLGLNAGALPAPVKLLYGAAVGFVLADSFGEATRVTHGLAVGLGLWLFIMAVLSPFFGWGFFCLAGHPSLSPGVPPYLQGGLSYAFMSLGLHLLFGAITGGLLGRLMGGESR
jgi:hypothetical protein